MHWTAGYRRGLPRELDAALKEGRDAFVAFLRRYSAETPSGCWEWTRTKTSRGYADVCDPRKPIDRRNPKRIVVSRLVCEIVHGTMAEWQREQARHACDNPPCVNPEHLLPGTPVDNQRDSTERGRRPSFRGELNPNWRHGRNVRTISLPDGT